ncbi:surface-adhesin E family protein [uncultured Moraxella sp.]|uniref:surface-adhesin E family protein n=1 Tax=uncultured Moraxella sp. TaxID=263769 RepID=UPI0025DE3C44|nr:surface-adhesin E family protein [uncultured Moraxella sp.]
MTQQAMAVNWFELGENNTDKLYIDLDSIQADTLVNGTSVMTAWQQSVYKQAQDAGGKKYWTSTNLYYFDCRARKFNLEYSVHYDKQGRVVDSFNNPDFSRYSSANWHRVVPGSGAELMLNTVCLFAN